MNEEIRRIIDPQTRGEIREFMRGLSDKEGVFRLMARKLTYEGDEGAIFYYYDGLADRLLFRHFPSGGKWKKLVRSLQALKRERNRGRYEVAIGEKSVIVSLVYSDKGHPTQSGKSLLETRFREIWQELSEENLPKKGVVLDEPVEIGDFTLQDLALQ